MQKNNYKMILGGLFTLAFVFAFSAGYGQAKIYNTGNAVFGDNSGITPSEQVYINGKLEGGTFGQTNQIKFDLSGVSSFPASDILFPAGGIYRSAQTNVLGINDVFFQGIPNNAAGYTFIENWFGQGLVFSSVNTGDGAPIIFATNRGEKARFTPTGSLGIGIQSPNAAALLHVNGAIHNAGGAVTSDKRLKKNIKKYRKGLDLVMKINPVSFEYNGKAGITTKGKRIGVLAQEIKEIAPYLVGEYKYVHEDWKKSSKIEEDYLYVQDDAFQFILINAIKEQQTLIDDLVSENNRIISEINQLKKMISNHQQSDQNESQIEIIDKASLKQNSPNPLNENTQIEFYIPLEIKNSRLIITSLNGEIAKEYNIIERGEGVINLKLHDLPSGTYFYSLIADNKLIDTRAMVIAE